MNRYPFSPFSKKRILTFFKFEHVDTEKNSKIQVRKRQKYTAEQVAILEEIYATDPMPNNERVRHFFQNVFIG
jgi:hypothetical protein